MPSFSAMAFLFPPKLLQSKKTGFTTYSAFFMFKNDISHISLNAEMF
jgi:hypothetical protein